MRPALQQVCNYVVQKIWNENREIVRRVVYESHLPEEYNRTGEFKEAWDYTDVNYNPTRMDGYGEFHYEPNNMSVGSADPNSDNYGQHIGVGPYKYYGEDARPYLADIIYHMNGCAGAGPAFGDGYWRKARNAWAELIRVIGKRKIKQWFKEGFEKVGFTVQMHNVPIDVQEG